MAKVLLILGIGIAVVGATYYFLFFNNLLSTQPKVSSGLPTPTLAPVLSPANSATFMPDISPVTSLLSPTPTPASSLEGKVAKLETTVTNLQQKIDSLSQNNSQTTAKSTLFVPLSSSFQSGDRNYITVDGSQVILDPGDFPGYTSMQLELSARLIETIGVVNVRFYDLTDQAAVGNSTVSTNATNLTFLSSNGFTLPAGKKTYVLQVQTTLGNNATIENARLRINF
ncbi:hypothetical protein M1563_05100 [Patescibacteria group bacterium]|nr:hypothetical protein [Patescibacteria group bacterium]MCL5409421.1 hypothetical protein [Patescibacteria group bacterium]